MKSEIKRKDLKSNFLKRTVLRLDYDYLFDEDIEKIRKVLNSFLVDKDYRMNSKTLSEYKINFDLEKLDNDEEGIDFNKGSKEEYFSFINPRDNIELNVTRNYANMIINYQRNIDFEKIIEVFDEVIEQVRNVRNKIQLNRIGIRKINMYFLKNIEKINNYFEERLFYFNELIDQRQMLVKRNTESFKYSTYKVNQNGEITKGIITNKETMEKMDIYRILLDIDVYDDNMDNNDLNLSNMNEIIFEVYKANLKEDFLNQLKKGNYQSEEFFKL